MLIMIAIFLLLYRQMVSYARITVMALPACVMADSVNVRS